MLGHSVFISVQFAHSVGLEGHSEVAIALEVHSVDCRISTGNYVRTETLCVILTYCMEQSPS